MTLAPANFAHRIQQTVEPGQLPTMGYVQHIELHLPGQAEAFRRHMMWFGQYDQPRWLSQRRVSYVDVDIENALRLEHRASRRVWLAPPLPASPTSTRDFVGSPNIWIMPDLAGTYLEIIEVGCSHSYLIVEPPHTNVTRYRCRHCGHAYDVDRGD